MKKTILILVGLSVLFLWWRIAYAEKPKPVVEVLQVIEVKTPEQLIVEEFSDAPIMLEVARAESRVCEDNVNPTSSARGCFQILKSTWDSEKCTGDVMVVEDNIACARVLYNRYKLTPWKASQHVWDIVK